MEEYNELFELGKLCTEKEEYSQAALYLEEYYEKTQDFRAHPLLVDALLKQGEPDMAFLRMIEFDKTYQTTPELHDLYFEILIKRKLFLRLGIWLNNLSPLAKSPFMERYKSSMIYWTTLDNEVYSNILKQFQSKLSQSKKEQLRLMHDMSFLTPGDFLDFAASALLEPNLSAIVRPQLIDYTIRLNEVKEISYLDYLGDKHTLETSDCLPLEQVFSAQPVLNGVREYLTHNQPSLIDMVISSVTMHIGLLYPLTDDIMSPVPLWIEAYLLTFEAKSQTSYPEEQEEINEIMALIRLLDEQMINIMGF